MFVWYSESVSFGVSLRSCVVVRIGWVMSGCGDSVFLVPVAGFCSVVGGGHSFMGVLVGTLSRSRSVLIVNVSLSSVSLRWEMPAFVQAYLYPSLFLFSRVK